MTLSFAVPCQHIRINDIKNQRRNRWKRILKQQRCNRIHTADGRLIQASTRGDGEVGEDITHNIPAFLNVPLTIPHKERLVITGESFIPTNDFERLKDTLRDGNGKPYKNGRNFASGSVRSLDPKGGIYNESNKYKQAHTYTDQ